MRVIVVGAGGREQRGRLVGARGGGEATAGGGLRPRDARDGASQIRGGETTTGACVRRRHPSNFCVLMIPISN